MLVASYVRPLLQAPLRAAIRPSYQLVEASDWGDLAEIVRLRSVDLLIVDPEVDGEADTRAVTNLLDQFPRIPLFVYTVLSRQIFRPLLDLSKQGLQEVVFHRYDDAPERFRIIIDHAARRRLGCQIAASISEVVEPNSRAIARAISHLFDRPQDFSSIEDVALRAQVPRWRLYSVLQGCGFKAPRRIFVAARVLRAHIQMRSTRSTVREVAAKLGYTDLETFSRHTHSALGVQPSGLRKQLADEEVTERLLEWIYAGENSDLESEE